MGLSNPGRVLMWPQILGKKSRLHDTTLDYPDGALCNRFCIARENENESRTTSCPSRYHRSVCVVCHRLPLLSLQKVGTSSMWLCSLSH